MSKTITVSDETWEKIKSQVEEETKNVKEKKKICLTIKNRWTGAIIWESEKTTYREAVEEAIKSHADLTRADLTDANLTGANLTRADLTDANLTDASLTGANLTGANLTRANLTGANLTRADLTDANLTGANLTRASLTGASLTDANLTGANLTGADLTGANLNACLYYMGAGNKNFEALCKAIKTIKHQDGSFDEITK